MILLSCPLALHAALTVSTAYTCHMGTARALRTDRGLSGEVRACLSAQPTRHRPPQSGESDVSLCLIFLLQSCFLLENRTLQENQNMTRPPTHSLCTWYYFPAACPRTRASSGRLLQYGTTSRFFASARSARPCGAQRELHILLRYRR